MLIQLSTRSCLEIRMQDEVHNIKIANISFERVEQFTYLGTAVTNQNIFMKKLRAD